MNRLPTITELHTAIKKVKDFFFPPYNKSLLFAPFIRQSKIVLYDLSDMQITFFAVFVAVQRSPL